MDSLICNSKLYVDSYQEDLFKNQDSGCSYISYENLKDHLNIKDINVDNITCATENTFVKVSKLFGNYRYSAFLGCKDSNDVDALPNIFYPEKMEMDDTCGVDAKAIMDFSFSPEEYTGNSKKKVSIEVTIRSNTGIDSRAKILYGFYKNDDINLSGNYKEGLVGDYTKVTKWNTLSLTIPDQATQLNQFKNEQPIKVTSKALETPQGQTGQYRLVLKIVELSDLAGVPWNSEEEVYEYSPGLFQIDNQAPVIHDFKVVSSHAYYRSNTPKIQIVATDNNKYSSNSELGACFSLDGNTPCNKVVSNMKARVPMFDLSGKYHKFSDINGQTVNIFPNNPSLYDSSYHTFRIVVSDKAGNYVEKKVIYQVAQRYTIHFNENYDSITGHGTCNPSSYSVIYNPESPGQWKGGSWESPKHFCTGPYRDYYYPILQWNKKKYTKYVDWQNDGEGVQVTENSYVSNSEKDLTVYAVWRPIDYSITYDLDGGSDPGNRSIYNYETPTFTLSENTRKDYHQFIGWTGSNGNTPASVTIPEKSHGNKSYKANWRPSYARIIYHVNQGYTIGGSYVAGGDGIVKLNGSYPFHIVEYGKKDDPYNYDNPNYINIDRIGYRGVSGAQWKTTPGKTPGINYNQDVVYVATDYCDMKYADCDAHLYVNWEPIPYNITYSCSDNVSNKGVYNIESPTFTLNNPSKWYYRFIGWTGSNGGIPQTTVTIPTGSYGDKAYNCNWDPYKAFIHYNVYGGVSESPTYPAINGWIYQNGSLYSTVIPYGSTHDVNNVNTRDYFKITRFAYETRDGEDWTNGSRTFNQDINYSPTEFCDLRLNDCDSYLYVNWKPVIYPISYNFNGGNDPGNPSTYTIESNTIVLKRPTRNYYRFIGWTGSNGSTPQLDVTIPNGSYGNKSYTANWEPYSAYVAYHVNGGYSNSSTYPQINGWIHYNNSVYYTKVPYGSSKDPNNVHTPGYFMIERVGYEGKSGQQWKTGDGSKTYNQDQLYAATDYCDLSGGDCYAYLYVNWTPIVYDISYNYAGGTAVGNPSRYTIEDTITLANPTREGYTFTGWTGTGLSGVTPNVSFRGGIGNRSYTANWQINTYILDVNGYLDGVDSGSIAGYGHFDVYINGVLVAERVEDYCASISYGSEYKIEKTTSSLYRRYDGVHSGSLTGKIPANNISVSLDYKTAKVIFEYYSEGGTLYRGRRIYDNPSYTNARTYKNLTGSLPTCNLSKPCTVDIGYYNEELGVNGLMGHYYETSGGCRGSFSIDYKNHVPIRNYCYNAKCTSSSKRIDESQSLVGVTREAIAREANSDNKRKL
ncbi:MAG: InlB B-repeat-containing protein, partial [Bacilli bacterium]|nr:InlB B-repeat-containing protein [Bacilli bacterium]